MKARASLVLIALLCPAVLTGAAAAPVDPLIGVRGTLSSSPPVTSSALQPLNIVCNELDLSGSALPADYLCASYDTVGLEIFSLDLQFFDEVQALFAATALTLDSFSDFTVMTIIDPFTVRLSNGVEGPPLTCFDGEISIVCPGLAIYTDGNPEPPDVPASFVRIVAVNGEPNEDVPEPAMLVLMGMAVTGLVRARRHRT